MMNVLVTGGAGYIGSHTCKALWRAGYRPVTYDNLIYGHEWAVKWGPLEKGDICDRERLSMVIETYRPSAVIHFAAFAYVGESVTDPAKYYENNVGGTLSLLAAMRTHNIPRIVFSSTCATYGIPDIVPIAEDASQRPINPYGMSKLMIERVLVDYSRAYGFRSVSLRYFNAAGADPDGEIGEAHDPETHLIPLVLDAAAGRRRDVTIFGTDYDTPDGTCIRDYVHVCDLADAHVLAMESLGAKNLLPAYNLGTGQGYSVAQVIEAAAAITKKTIPIMHGSRRPGDPAELVAISRSAASDLGWIAARSDISTIIDSAWRWLEKSHNFRLAEGS